MTAGRTTWLRRGAIVLGGIALVAIAYLAFRSLTGQPVGLGASSTKTLPCSPQPCLDIQNYTLWVSNVSEDGPLVKMQVTFRNASDSTHAAPEDLRLVDAQGDSSPSVQDDPGCTNWSGTEFNNGQRFGPIILCFRPTSTNPPLKLRWSPDMGLLSCEADIRIR